MLVKYLLFVVTKNVSYSFIHATACALDLLQSMSATGAGHF